jgi:hypothetical protein
MTTLNIPPILAALGVALVFGIDGLKATVNSQVVCVYQSPGYEAWGALTSLLVLAVLALSAYTFLGLLINREGC